MVIGLKRIVLMKIKEGIKKDDDYKDYVNFVMDSMYKEDLKNWLKQQQIIQTINILF